MNKILTINKKTDTYWFQWGKNGHITGLISKGGLEDLLTQAKEIGTLVFDITKIKPAVMARLYKKFFTGRGYTENVDEYAEALVLNGAKKIK